MERKNILIIILVVALVVGFITELFYFGGSYKFNFGGGSAAAVHNVTGTAVFNGSIRTYNPVLQIPGNTSQDVVERLRNLQGVKDVRVQANLDLVETETRDDVYPVAVALRQMNVTDMLTVANIAVPQDISVVTDNGTINVSMLDVGGVVQVVTEPFVDSGNEVPVSLTAVIQDGLLIDYYGAHILAERTSVMADATVAGLANATYTYAVPWEGRGAIDLAALNGSGYSYAYKRVDTILFSPPLNITGVISRKSLPYITFIDTASAEVSPDYANVSSVRLDFAGTNVTFPDSTLTVTGASAPELTDLDGSAPGYEPDVSYAYVLALPGRAGGFDLGNDTSFIIRSPRQLELNSTVPLNVTVLAIGNNVLSVAVRQP